MSSSYLKKISLHKCWTILLGGILLCSVAGIAAASVNAPLGIDQSSFVSLRGIDQWISIRGEDRRNPVLLVVHDGPGEAQWAHGRKIQAVGKIICRRPMGPAWHRTAHEFVAALNAGQ